ncbi:helix-turn-helix domain-containing protein [Streptomyces sp. NPDC049590]|uniref:helix-turn-helix domain-containing protein n=1 Tax=Streptomyces sp. NPDC049590 TaxID=3154834 RepID=UPI0034272345
MTESLGELLRRLRRQAKLTQEKLAELSDVSVSTIRRMETGKPFDHRSGSITKLADALRPSPEDRRLLASALGGGPDAAAPAEQPTPPPAPGPPGALRVPAPRGPLADVAEELARDVRGHWRHEEEQRRVHHPAPLPVRLRAAASGLADHAENWRLRAADGPAEQELNGDLRKVVDVYHRAGPGRLVILGRAGAGKTVLAVRLTLDLLKERASHPAFHRVPVIFSIGSWDPVATGLHGWLAERLIRDHPHLARRLPSGKTLAADVLDADLVLPVLDGFDEIAEGLRATALDALSRLSTPLVLTSRLAEYAEAVERRAPLASAAAVELCDLSFGNLREYLPLTSPVPPDASRSTETWGSVLDEALAREASGGAHLLHALRTPLMTSLARVMYSDRTDRSPAELLDTGRFPDARAIEEHLLAGFVPAAYERRVPEPAGGQRARRVPRDAGQAQRWLSHLAHHLVRFDRERQDLAWWQLGESLRRSTRVLAVVLASTLCVAIATWTVGLASMPLTPDSPVALGAAQIMAEGAMTGLAGGLAFGVTYAVVLVRRGGRALEPTRVQLRAPGARRRPDRRSARETTAYLGAVFAGGLVMGAGIAVVTTLQNGLFFDVPLANAFALRFTLTNMLLFGLIFGPAACLVFGLVIALEAPFEVTVQASPAGLLVSNRASVRRQVLVLAPLLTLAIALSGYLLVRLLDGAFGELSWSLSSALSFGVTGGLGGTAAYVLGFTAWGQWILFSRICLPLTGRLPWDTMAFLEDAYHRGILRRPGAVHQFAHLRVQHHLARAYRDAHAGYRPVSSPRPRRARD